MERAQQDQWRIVFGTRARCNLLAPGEPMKDRLVYQTPDEDLARRVYKKSTYGTFPGGYRLGDMPTVERQRSLCVNVETTQLACRAAGR